MGNAKELEPVGREGSATRSKYVATGMGSETARQLHAAWQRDLTGSSKCVLSWSLAEETVSCITKTALILLHAEVLALAEMVGGVVLSTEATTGAMCFEGTGPFSSVTPEDSAVRFGQLLCRWA